MVIGVGVSTCRIGDLFSVPPAGLIYTIPGPDQGADSVLLGAAPVGSRALHVMKIFVGHTGKSTLDWSATAGGSAWLSIKNPSGTSGDSISVVANPAGLVLRVYWDTVTVNSSVGGTILVPVRFEIDPCSQPSIASTGGQVTDTLNSADCGAPNRTNTYQADLFAFTGTAGNVVSVLLSAGFNGFVALDTATTNGLVPLDTALQCLGDTKTPCIYYYRLPSSSATYVIEVSGATPADTGLFTIRLIGNNNGGRNPNQALTLKQFLIPDSTQQVNIGDTVTASVLVHAVVSDSDVVDNLRLEAEWQPIGTPFLNQAMGSPGPLTQNGDTASVTLTGLQDNTGYHWQVRTRDQTGNVGPWDSLPRGSVPDFIVQLRHNPFPPTNLAQLQFDGTTPIPHMGYANTTTVKFSGTVSSPDSGDTLHLEVEVVSPPAQFTGNGSPNQTATLSPNPGTSIATLIAPTIVDTTSYKWQARAVGNTGRTSSWVRYSSDPFDFRDSVQASFNLVWTGQPSQTTAGVAIAPAPQITATDALGHTITNFNGPVTMTISGPGPFAPSATTTVTANAGVATFSNLIINGAGPGYKFIATSGTINSVASSSFAIVAAPAAQLVFTGQPSNTVSGAPITPAVQVTVEDAFGNAALTYSTAVVMTIRNDAGPGGVLAGTTSAVPSAGVANFGTLSIAKAGNGYTLGATSGSLPPSPASSSFNITAGPVTHLAFTVPPSNAPAGVTIAPPVQVAGEDANNNVNATFTSTVTLAIGTNPSGGTLSGAPPTAAVNGIATFSSLSIDKIGNGYTLTAASSTLQGATSPTFNITNAQISNTLSTVVPTPATITASSGSSQSTIAVTARDLSNNTVANASVTLSVTGSNNTILPAGSQLTNGSGVATWTLSSTFAEVKTITATINSVSINQQPTVTVIPAPPSALFFTPQPTSTGAGAAINGPSGVFVTARDQFGNTATSFTATVAMAVAGPGPFAPTSTNSATANAGVANFPSLRIYQAGPGYTLTASSGALTSGASSAFSINVGPAVRDTFSVQPGTTQVLVPIDSAIGGIRVSITDSVGNTVTTDNTHTITMAQFGGPSGATLNGTKTKTVSLGVATFTDLTLNKMGTSYTLNAVSNLPTNPSDISAPFDIIAGPAKSLGFKTQPSTVVAGQAISPPVQVAALDAVGDTATSFTGTVTMTLNPSSGNLGGTVTAAAASGIATFSNLTVGVAGPYTLTASTPPLPTGPVTSGTSTSFTVQPGGVSAGNSTVGALPGSITASSGSSTSTITVTARDAGNNVISGATVVLSISGTMNTTSPVSLTATTNGGGQAIWTLSSTVAESKTVSAVINTISINQTATVVVNPASPAVLVFTKQPPASVTAGVAIAPAVQVEVRDQFANKVTNASNQVTLSFIQTGRGPLSGNTAMPSAGTATFASLTATQTTTGLTPDSLLATATGLTPDTSTGFAVNPAAVSTSQSTVAASLTTITACQSSCSPGAGTQTAVTVTAKDQFGNGVSGASVTIAISGTGGNTTSPVSLTQTANGSGVAQWTLNSTIAELKTISATANSVGITQTVGVTVDPSTVSAAMSTVAANPTSISACAASCSTGAGTASQITVTATDQFGNPVPSASVTLAVSGTLNTTSPASLTQTANGSGVATWTLSSSVAETKTISATANSVGITQTATVTVNTTGVSASQSTVGASLATITACQTSCSTGGGTATVITVAAKDQLGNGVGGASVTIAITGSSNATTPVSLTQTANGNGVATWKLSSTVAEGKTVSATANSVAITQTAAVTVNPGAISAAQSTVTTAQTTDSACSSSCTTAAGLASLITITAKDQFLNLIQGATVVMSGSPGTGNNFTPASNTNSSGVSTSTFNSTKAEQKTISATVGGVLVTQTAAVTVIPAGINAGNSSLTPGLSSITACASSCTQGGGTGSNITVTAKDAFNNVIQNAKVVLSSTGSNPAFSPAPPNTNSSGVSTSTFSSTTAEGKTISGTLQVGSGSIVAITQTAGVTVIPGTATQLTFTSEPTTTNHNATITPDIVVTAFDQFGNVATGYTGTITLSISPGTPATGGPGGLTGTNPVTAASGVATFSGLSMTDIGTSYSLDASDGVLKTTSSAFDIN